MAKIELTVTLYPSEILYDIENKTHLLARTSAEGDSILAAADTIVDGSEEADNQVIRSLNAALATLQSRLGEYVKSNDVTTHDVLTRASQPYALTLSVPTNFNKANTQHIGALAHQFMVNQSIGEWYALTSKESAEYFTTLASANLDSIIEYINKRERPVRKS